MLAAREQTVRFAHGTKREGGDGNIPTSDGPERLRLLPDCKKLAVPLLHFGVSEGENACEKVAPSTQIQSTGLAQERKVGLHLEEFGTTRPLTLEERCADRLKRAEEILRRVAPERRFGLLRQEEPPEKKAEQPIQVGTTLPETARPFSSVLPPETSRSIMPNPPTSTRGVGFNTTPTVSASTRTEQHITRRVPESSKHAAPALGDSVQEEFATKRQSSPKAADSSSDQDSSNIKTDKSLNSEQLQAYREVEQAEMTCELQRMENVLSEERERNIQLQNTFSQELIAQRDAHTRDVKALEDVIAKVLEDNRRLSVMVEGLCGQVEQGSKHWVSRNTSFTTGTPTSSSGRSQKISCASTSSSGGTPSSKEIMPLSSETEMSTDTQLPTSSDDAH